MGKISGIQYLSKLDKAFQNKGIVRIWIKRFKEIKKYGKNSRRKEQKKYDNKEQLDPVALIIKQKSKNNAYSYQINPQENMPNYINSFINVLRLYMFKDKKQKKKPEIKLKTQANPQSKSSKKKELRKMRNRERRIMRKRIKKQMKIK